MVYTIGNPTIAQTMLKWDLRGAYNIPPRLLVLEKPAGGTIVLYHQPSSVMVFDDNASLKAAAEELDAKLDRMLTRVTSL